MAMVRIGRGHHARKALFHNGLRRGFLTVQEIEEALPPGALTASERWLLYYSLRAAQIEIRDESGTLVSVPPLSEEERARLGAERGIPAGPPRGAGSEAHEGEEGEAQEESPEGPAADSHHPV